jgi:hypothetical protein
VTIHGTLSPEELTALNARAAEELERKAERLAPRERPDVKLVRQNDEWQWLIVDGVPMRRRVVSSSRD